MKTMDFSELIAASDLKGSTGCPKKNDATFNQYSFLYFNLNWYAFNNTIQEIDILQESATETTPNTNYASMVAMETNMLIFRF